MCYFSLLSVAGEGFFLKNVFVFVVAFCGIFSQPLGFVVVVIVLLSF